jgi:putative transcriptional regulator
MTTKAFDKIMRGLNEARDFASRGSNARQRKVKVSRNDVAALRLREGLTQAQFADLLGTSLGTVRKWESGERAPSGAAARLLELLEASPKLVTKTLGFNSQTRKKASKRDVMEAA